MRGPDGERRGRARGPRAGDPLERATGPLILRRIVEIQEVIAHYVGAALVGVEVRLAKIRERVSHLVVTGLVDVVEGLLADRRGQDHCASVAEDLRRAAGGGPGIRTGPGHRARAVARTRRRRRRGAAAADVSA